jgi:hypothetical protein
MGINTVPCLKVEVGKLDGSINYVSKYLIKIYAVYFNVFKASQGAQTCTLQFCVFMKIGKLLRLSTPG